jgi:hypothetical protein
MSESEVPANLPTLSEWISGLLGFRLPSIPLVRTGLNLEKALEKVILAGGENAASRIKRNTSWIEARTKADVRVIEASGKYVGRQVAAESAFTERALEFTYRDSLLKQDNREKIGMLALEDFSAKMGTQTVDAETEIDDDWLNSFTDFASQKSTGEIQILWGRILSGKIRRPSSFSLKSLQLLSTLDTRDANLIHELLSYAIQGSFIYKAPMWKDIGQFITGEDLGVLSGTGGRLGKTFLPTVSRMSGIPLAILFPMSGAVLHVSAPVGRPLPIPCFNLTRFGQDLLSLSDDLVRDPEYEQEFIGFLKKNGATVRRCITGMPLEDV